MEVSTSYLHPSSVFLTSLFSPSSSFSRHIVRSLRQSQATLSHKFKRKMVFGYAYPAYECFKVVEKSKPKIEQLTFWCQYWILVATITVCERLGDAFVSWVPMYSEAKLALFMYLCYTRTKGTAYMYGSLLRPVVAKHEKDIDRSLSEMKIKVAELAIVYWQKTASFGQARVFEVLQYVSSHSAALRPHPSDPLPTKTGKSSQGLFTYLMY